MSMNENLTLFLDFDGVLNNRIFAEKQRENPKEYIGKTFDSANLKELSRLCKSLSIDSIVVTSTWRIGKSIESLREMLARDGFDRSELIYDKTDDSTAGRQSRYEEIKDWLEIHGDRPYLIIDDNDIGCINEPRFYRVNSMEGLSTSDVDQLIKQLQA